jgi:hypothetical protein
MKPHNCLMCYAPATVKKELVMAMNNLSGFYYSTRKYFHFCAYCYEHALPGFIDKKGDNHDLQLRSQ